MSLYWTLRRRFFAVRNWWIVRNCPHQPWTPARTSLGLAKHCRACRKTTQIGPEEFYAVFGRFEQP